MKFTSGLQSINLRMGDYRRALLNALREYNERAGQAWIHAAVNNTPIPTWSGASRATFKKLASELSTSVPIGPIKARTDRTSLGISTSAGSGVYEDKSSMQIGFVYSTSLRYLAYNEYHFAVAGPPPQPYSNRVRFTPYNFQPRAREAWEAVAKAAKLPNPLNYLSRRKM